MYKIKPIGVFDSGVGGLSVVEEINKQIPNADIIYFGDTAHVPYGPKPVEKLIKYADDITDFLIKKGVGIIIDACNSTSSVALDYLKGKYSNTIIGVVTPGIISAIKNTKNGNIGVIGTQATVESKSHAKNASIIDNQVVVFGQACPAFVPFIEKGEVKSKEVHNIALEYLQPLIDKNIDTLILGCTHYPYLKEVIKKIVGDKIKIIDPAVETVKEAKIIYNTLQELSYSKNSIKKEKYYVSGNPVNFRRIGSKLSSRVLPEVEKVII